MLVMHLFKQMQMKMPKGSSSKEAFSTWEIPLYGIPLLWESTWQKCFLNWSGSHSCSAVQVLSHSAGETGLSSQGTQARLEIDGQFTELSQRPQVTGRVLKSVPQLVPFWMYLRPISHLYKEIRTGQTSHFWTFYPPVLLYFSWCVDLLLQETT